MFKKIIMGMFFVSFFTILSTESLAVNVSHKYHNDNNLKDDQIYEEVKKNCIEIGKVFTTYNKSYKTYSCFGVSEKVFFNRKSESTSTNHEYINNSIYLIAKKRCKDNGNVFTTYDKNNRTYSCLKKGQLLDKKAAFNNTKKSQQKPIIKKAKTKKEIRELKIKNIKKEIKNIIKKIKKILKEDGVSESKIDSFFKNILNLI